MHRQPLNAELTEYLNKYENIIIKYEKYERNFCLITKNVNSKKISQMNDNFDNTIKKIIDNLKYLSKYDGDVFYFDLFKEIIEYHSILKISEDEILNLLINKISVSHRKLPAMPFANALLTNIRLLLFGWARFLRLNIARINLFLKKVIRL